MQDFVDKKIVLGICGGIAAYKAAFLVRELTRLGAEVRVVMTKSAQQFITPLTLQALSGHEVRCDLFDSSAERAMGHIELARWADYLVIAPASANCLAKLAYGLADDLLTTLYLVCEVPVVMCPAMNRSMWFSPATTRNCAVLRERGVMMVGPEEGEQACGELGYGRMAEPEDIINALRLTAVQNVLLGKKVMVTAGPTWESIDPVRFISNRSSGKMGYALATAAQIAGADVTLISGSTALICPHGVKFHSVQSAQEMHEQVMAKLEPGMIFIGCAAVADYAVAKPAKQKIKKSQSAWSIELTLNPDIVSEVVKTKQCAYVVGFAAETNNVLTHARQKLEAKKIDMVVANLVGEALGFEQDENEVTVMTATTEVKLPKAHKIRVAGQIVAILDKNMHNSGV
ncbi:MAG: phosphopantothenoylcysteine decarboxylase [Legionellales bacterium RIFCSPHIGHO2_12_FULL_42_9]|nr:MAG: phosphopantothenoylcysteine decarboxylase [Legionellales bacterium RIFCSPHIGHO2_12_FULL_42_9]